jgi:hypothetical protein
MAGVPVHYRTDTNMGFHMGYILWQAAEISRLNSRYVGPEPVNIPSRLCWDCSGQ